MAVLYVCDRCGEKLNGLMSMVNIESNVDFPYFYRERKINLCRKCTTEFREFLGDVIEYTEQPEYAFD